MTNIDVDNLAQIIRQVDGNHDLGAGALAEAILDHLPAPQIIRTVEELEALDNEDFLMTLDGNIYYAIGAKGRLFPGDLPAVLVAPAAQVRAALKALEKENNND